MRINHDLGPAASQVARIADGVDDDQLGAETPCADWPVAVLLSHLIGLSTAFTAAARKKRAPDGGPEPAGRLPGDWKSGLRERLDALVAAWRDPEAWQGRTEIADLIMPAGTVGVIALDELVLHGWDLARATGQPFHAEPADVRASLGFAASMSEPGQEAAREGLYGPAVPVSEGAPDLERLLGLAGRDPQWTSGGGALTASSERGLLDDGSAPLPWTRAQRLADEGSGTCWLSTTVPGGAPHVRPLLIVWVRGCPHFASGDGTRKSRALAEDGRCGLAVDAGPLHLVVEGAAVPVDDPSTLREVADAYRRTHGWHVEVRGQALHHEEGGAPTAGPPPWRVWRLNPDRAFGFPADGTLTPTLWTFRRSGRT